MDKIAEFSSDYIQPPYKIRQKILDGYIFVEMYFAEILFDLILFYAKKNQ